MFDTVLPVLPTRPRVGLNPQQQAAVDHRGRGSPLLIVAGAGTGKTRTLTARVASLIDDGGDPARILLLTFTRRAAAEMLGRVVAATNSRASHVWGGTFHSVANRLLRRYARTAGIGPGFTVLDQADSTDLFGMARTQAGLGERAKRFPRAQTIAGIYSRMVNSQAKLQDVLDTDYPWCSEHTDDLRTVFTTYSAAKRSNGVLDYDDLLLFWRGLTAGTIGASLRAMFDHVLIDEYQDTNAIQADIVRGMCGPHTDLCAVGDDAQAIYGFRAATVANMWDFHQHFPGARTITLEQNYRSTMAVLAVGNAVLNQPEPYAQVHHAKQLWSDRNTGPKPVLATHYDEGAQARAVAVAVLDARERGIDLREHGPRTRAHQARHPVREVRRACLPRNGARKGPAGAAAHFGQPRRSTRLAQSSIHVGGGWPSHSPAPQRDAGYRPTPPRRAQTFSRRGRARSTCGTRTGRRATCSHGRLPRCRPPQRTPARHAGGALRPLLRVGVRVSLRQRRGAPGRHRPAGSHRGCVPVTKPLPDRTHARPARQDQRPCRAAHQRRRLAYPQHNSLGQRPGVERGPRVARSRREHSIRHGNQRKPRRPSGVGRGATAVVRGAHQGRSPGQPTSSACTCHCASTSTGSPEMTATSWAR